MTSHKRRRATAIVEWAHNSSHGVLVHVDPVKHTWILPGGGIEHQHNGRREISLIAAVRELEEETRLRAHSVERLFEYEGKYQKYYVFAIRAHGSLQIVAPSEAPAFGLWQSDGHVIPILSVPGFTAHGLRVSSSTKTILTRYSQHRALHDMSMQ